MSTGVETAIDTRPFQVEIQTRGDQSTSGDQSPFGALGDCHRNARVFAETMSKLAGVLVGDRDASEPDHRLILHEHMFV
jgi:hypothetical protein